MYVLRMRILSPSPGHVLMADIVILRADAVLMCMASEFGVHIPPAQSSYLTSRCWFCGMLGVTKTGVIYTCPDPWCEVTWCLRDRMSGKAFNYDLGYIDHGVMNAPSPDCLGWERDGS